jgi:hypothetical protein
LRSSDRGRGLVAKSAEKRFGSNQDEGGAVEIARVRRHTHGFVVCGQR